MTMFDQNSLSTPSADTASRIEALLFVEGGSLTLKRLEHILGISREEVQSALAVLSSRLCDRGLTLIATDIEATLAASGAVSDTVRAAYERELGKEIGEAGLEVLAILLYSGPSTRARIDHIRGVNTSTTIRALLSRGLIERSGNANDGREYVYRPTVELLAHLGIHSASELSDYDTITRELSVFEQSQSPFQSQGHEHVHSDSVTHIVHPS